MTERSYTVSRATAEPLMRLSSAVSFVSAQ